MTDRASGIGLFLIALGVPLCGLAGLLVLGLIEVGDATGIATLNAAFDEASTLGVGGALLEGLLMGMLVGLVVAMLVTRRRAAGVMLSGATVMACVLAFVLVSRVADGSTIGLRRAGVVARFVALNAEEVANRPAAPVGQVARPLVQPSAPAPVAAPVVATRSPAQATSTPTQEPVRYTPPPTPPPTPSPSEDSGFSPATWSVGSRWIYDVERRSTRAVVDEAAPLHFRSIWTIESTSQTADGKRVVLVDEGGDKKKTKTDVFIEQGCIRFGKSKARSFCLSDGRQVQVSVAGAQFTGITVQTSDFEYTLVPEIGVVRIVGEADRRETETTVELIAYEVGGRSAGNTTLAPITCDWYISKRSLKKIRSIEGDDVLSAVAARFLGAPTGRISVDLTDRHGARTADAATDDRMSVLRVSGVAGPLGEGVQLRGKLRALKGHESLDGSTDYLMVTTMDDREMLMHMLPIRNGRVSGDIHISAMVADPKMDYSETFLTNDGPDACKLQVVVGNHGDKSYLVADYLFEGETLRRRSGSLNIQSHTWRDTSSLQ